VLDDPSGAGFLVYLLRPKTTDDEIPVGGPLPHLGSADGRTVTQIDRLWRSCLTFGSATGDQYRGENGGDRNEPHRVGDAAGDACVPVPPGEDAVLCVTSDGRLWNVDGDAILQANSEQKAEAEAKPER
jgi:hypothetical protein